MAIETSLEFVQKLSAQTSAILAEDSTFLPQMDRTFEKDFDGTTGDSIKITRQTPLATNRFDRTNPQAAQRLQTSSTNLTLTDWVNLQVAVTDEEQAMVLDGEVRNSFAQNAANAIKQDVESFIAANILTGVTQSIDGETNLVTSLADAGTLLRKKHATDDLVAIVGADLYGEYIKQPPFLNANTAGSDAALRNGHLGRAFNFDTYATTQEIGKGSNKGAGVAMRRGAVAFASTTLALPEDQIAAVESVDGIGVRVIRFWNQVTRQTEVVFDFHMGMLVLEKDHIVKIAEPTVPSAG